MAPLSQIFTYLKVHHVFELLQKYPDLKSSTSKISPIAWRHINFTGKYTFKEKKSLPDLKEIIEKLKKWL